ncbi:MAG: MarR family transcriptional regulator [Sphingomonas fennica]
MRGSGRKTAGGGNAGATDDGGYAFVPQTYDPDSPEGLRLSLHWWLGTTDRMWRRLLDERLRGQGQTHPRWRVLAWARLVPGITQTDLAQRMAISGPTLVRILDGLAAQGMIERRDDPHDRRVKEIHLTAEAGPIVQAISEQVRAIRTTVLEDVSEAELRFALDILARIRTRVQALRSEPGEPLPLG